MVADAREELGRISRVDERKPEVLGIWVELYLAEERWEEMADLSRDLAKDHHDQTQWWVHWAYALREQQQVKEAKEVALRGLERHPDEPILHFNLACYLSLLGEFDEASDHMNRAISLDKRFEEESVQDPDLVGLWDWFSKE